VTTDGTMKPCGFCYEHGHLQVIDKQVVCPCGARGPAKSSNEEAVRAWNNPPMPASVIMSAVEAAGMKVEIAASLAAGWESRTRVKNALDILTEFSGIDGSHHKNWTMDQAVRALCGVRNGPHGYAGEGVNEEYTAHVFEACKGRDGTPWVHDWDEGVAP
jgi:hypothetical protein